MGFISCIFSFWRYLFGFMFCFFFRWSSSLLVPVGLWIHFFMCLCIFYVIMRTLQKGMWDGSCIEAECFLALITGGFLFHLATICNHALGYLQLSQNQQNPTTQTVDSHVIVWTHLTDFCCLYLIFAWWINTLNGNCCVMGNFALIGAKHSQSFGTVSLLAHHCSSRGCTWCPSPWDAVLDTAWPPALVLCCLPVHALCCPPVFHYVFSLQKSSRR